MTLREVGLHAKLILVLNLAAAACRREPAPPARVAYEAPRACGPIRIDGVADEPDWARAPAVRLAGSMDGVAAEPPTTARVLWDAAHVYLAFDARDDDIWSPYTTRDSPMYEAEVVEAFFDADGSESTYNELEVAPTGAIFDAYFPARRRGMDLSWDSGMAAAVKVDGEVEAQEGRGNDNGWTAEMRVPVARLAAVPRWPPQEGDAWRFNLYRLEVRHGQRGQSLAPVRVPDFHHLPAFADLRFVETGRVCAAP